MKPQPDGLPLVYRGGVQIAECDENHHANVRFYVDKGSLGLSGYLLRAGLGPQRLAAEGLVLDVKRMHVRFLAELHHGTPIYMVGGTIPAPAAGDGAFGVQLELRRSLNHSVSAVVRCEAAVVTRSDGRPIDLPAEVRAFFEANTVDPGTPHPPRSIMPDAALDAAPPESFLEISRTVATPSLLDAQGRFAEWAYIGAISDGMMNLLEPVRATAPNIGGAGLEFMFEFRARPPLGAIVTVHSAVRRFDERLVYLDHHIIDAETGVSYAAARTVNGILDRVARRLVPIHPTFSEEIGAIVVP